SALGAVRLALPTRAARLAVVGGAGGHVAVVAELGLAGLDTSEVRTTERHEGERRRPLDHDTTISTRRRERALADGYHHSPSSAGRSPQRRPRGRRRGRTRRAPS